MISSGVFITEIIVSFEIRDTMIGITETAKEQGSSKGVACFFFLNAAAPTHLRCEGPVAGLKFSLLGFACIQRNTAFSLLIWIILG